MNSDKVPQDELQKESRLARERMWAEYLRVGPKVSMGDPSRSPGRLTSGRFFTIYFLFNAVCLVLGFTFVFFQGASQALGVSLVVGGLFSFGAFVAQVWSVAAQREAQAIDRAFDEGSQDIRQTDLRRLAKAWWELSERVSEGARSSGHDTSTSAT